jgi:hypothetical protein
MECAQMVESKFQLAGRTRTGSETKSVWSNFNQTRTLLLEITHNPNIQPENLNPKPVTNSNNYSRLTESEIRQKKKNGLCFKCDGRYRPNHRCPSRELAAVIIQDEIAIEEEFLNPFADEQECKVADVEAVNVEVSSQSVDGLNGPKTMKLEGEIMGRKVVVLLDSGASHNFISHNLVAELQLHKSDTGSYGVTLGTGVSVPGTGICKGVKLSLQGIEVIEEFLPLQLGSSDVILGIQWLSTLGLTHINWKDQTLRFRAGEKQVVLQGDPKLTKSQISLKVMVRHLKKSKEGFWVELNNLESKSAANEVADPRIQQLLQRFSQIFELPKGLPPSRGHEHAIELKNGTMPENVRPFRYPLSKIIFRISTLRTRWRFGGRVMLYPLSGLLTLGKTKGIS